MAGLKQNDLEKLNLPFQIQISFKKIYDLFVEYASDAKNEHPFHNAAKKMKAEIEKKPKLINGFSDFSLLKKNEQLITWLTEPLFPEVLENNEIKAACVPFEFTGFRFTQRFKSILDNAGDDYEIEIKDLDKNMIYRVACSSILTNIYGYTLDLKTPFYFDIPDKNTGITHHYRLMYNADFTEIIPTENAPKITETDYRELIDNFDDMTVWKEKFPPKSYILKGFGIMNLFNATADVTISEIRSELLKTDTDLNKRIEDKIRDFFHIKDLRVGFSIYDLGKNTVQPSEHKRQVSFILNNNQEIDCKSDFFCHKIQENVFENHNPFVISDLEVYGKNNSKSGLYQKLKQQNIGSVIIIPIKVDTEKDLLLMEFASPRPLELNSVVMNKLNILIPSFKTAIDRSVGEFNNQLEAIIQEHYTSIHPSVKWRFVDSAQKYLTAQMEGEEDIEIDEIVFNNVYPLYGQSDIKGSSTARNKAIKEDLTTQLNLAISVLKEACKTEKIPIYEELMFRVEEYLGHVNDGLKSGDETVILSFLKREIYPVFSHIKTLNEDLKALVKSYLASLDENLQVVYKKRKAYEHSVTILNDRLSRFIDKKEEEAQAMFPHYFERYKTDGVEYNMYIGQSLTKDKKFNKLYLYNLRLWQLQLMCEMENVAMKSTIDMEQELRIASLILVHSNPLAIKFRMDEKQFDVDGAYNVRYEIIKKRIDKSHIKGTNERITIPGKIAIIYSQEKNAVEYLKYIKYLQSKNQLGEIEMLEIEDLDGVSGLKAIRVEVIYNKDFCEKSTVTIDELIKEFK